MAIKISELNPRRHYIDESVVANLHILHYKLNYVRRLYDDIMIVNSGLRSSEEHKEIYLAKGVVVSPPGSQHLVGAAGDIRDQNNQLKTWIHSNMDVIEKVDLYLEDFSATPTWVHFQIYPPHSGKRIFIP